MTKRLFKGGAATLIFLMVIALTLTLLLAATQSRLLLALRRSQTSADTLIASYKAESVVNDIMAKLDGGYIKDADINSVEYIDGMKIELSGEDKGSTQIITATVTKDYAVGKVQGIRRIQKTGAVNNVEIVMALDCTSSMDDPASCTGSNCPSIPTRFDAMEDAAVNFVDEIAKQEDSEKFKIGIATFGTDSKWLKYNGIDVTPDSGLSFNQIVDALRSGFSTTRGASSACSGVMDGTSIGSAFSFAHSYLATTKESDTKQIEVVITDGEPNSRIPDSKCSPNTFCPVFGNFCSNNPYGWTCSGSGSSCESQGQDYLSCTLADSGTYVSNISQNGTRDPDVDAYSVTIFDNPPADVVNIFRDYGTQDGYYNASQATQLTDILSAVLNNIIEERSNISIKRIIPLPE